MECSRQRCTRHLTRHHSIACPWRQSTPYNTPLSFTGVNGITVNDVVDADGLAEQVTLSVGNGTINLSGTAGLSLVSGAFGSASMTFSGTLPANNAALDGMTYTPALDYSGSDTLTITANDLGNTGGGGPLSATSDIDIAIQSTAGTTTDLKSSADPSPYAQDVIFTATVNVAGGTPTGTVIFQDGSFILGSAVVNASGQASLTISALGLGNHNITATYGGDGPLHWQRYCSPW